MIQTRPLKKSLRHVPPLGKTKRARFMKPGLSSSYPLFLHYAIVFRSKCSIGWLGTANWLIFVRCCSLMNWWSFYLNKREAKTRLWTVVCLRHETVSPHCITLDSDATHDGRGRGRGRTRSPRLSYEPRVASRRGHSTRKLSARRIWSNRDIFLSVKFRSKEKKVFTLLAPETVQGRARGPNTAKVRIGELSVSWRGLSVG